MEPLVVAAGSALVAAMATDAWQQARTSAVELWRRVHPERVPAVEAELVEVREELLAARDSGETGTAEELALDWQRRLDRLLRADPGLADELRRVLDDHWLPATGAPPYAPQHHVQQHGTASGRQSQVYQAGGDLHINDR
ncbi:hypothetical protein ACIBCB_11310 [Streptomyces uncialis]|uniref:hypothetical protein n=1 Tax=Streptomyces uncialis TaxID=1048205 RepID=UPI0037BB9168